MVCCSLADLLWPGAGHGEVLPVDVPPAGEQAVGRQEEEQVLPLQPQLVLVQNLGEQHVNVFSDSLGFCISKKLHQTYQQVIKLAKERKL